MDQEHFKTIFYGRYFSLVICNQNYVEFAKLKQENMTLVEYKAKFNELQRFPPLVDMEEKKVKNCLIGLRLGIERAMMSKF